MRKIHWIVIFVIGILQGGAFADFRVWSSKDGSSNVEARFIKSQGKNVVLEKKDGKRVVVPKSKLSAADMEYLVGVIPPEIKLDVDVDKDTMTISESEYHQRKKVDLSFVVDIKKINKDKCDRSFSAQFYAIAESINGDAKMVIAFEEHSFSFKNNNTSQFSAEAEVTYTDDYWEKAGWEYEGYIVVVKGDDGSVLAMDTTKSAYENAMETIHKNRKAKKGNRKSTFKL